MNHDATTPPGPEVWGARAACADEDPELFFPSGQGPATRDQVSAALDVCARCPVLDLCRTWALSPAGNGVREGIVGGLTEDERQQYGGPALTEKQRRAAFRARFDVEEINRAVETVLAGHPDGLYGLNSAETDRATLNLAELRGISGAASLLGVCTNTIHRRQHYARHPERRGRRSRRPAAAEPVSA